MEEEDTVQPAMTMPATIDRGYQQEMLEESLQKKKNIIALDTQLQLLHCH